MRAIRTGIFRSKLESRWAHYFNALDILWGYEKEKVKISDALSYIPDFWLPTYNIWVEIKGEIVNDWTGLTIVQKCEGVARVTGRPIVLAFYDPLAVRAAAFLPTGEMYGNAHWGVCPTCYRPAVLIRGHDELCPHGEKTTTIRETSRRMFQAAQAARNFHG